MKQPKEMTWEELLDNVITTDFKGKDFKRECLSEK